MESPYGAVISALQMLQVSELTWESATARLLQEYNVGDSRKKYVNEVPDTTKRALKTKAKALCYQWGNFGRYRRECRRKKDRIKNHNNTQQFDLVTREQRQPWGEQAALVIDSGATCDMVNDVSLASRFRPVTPRTINLGDGRSIESNLVGNLEVRTTTPAAIGLLPTA